MGNKNSKQEEPTTATHRRPPTAHTTTRREDHILRRLEIPERSHSFHQPQTPVEVAQPDRFVAVCSIDFGTSYSGYAFSFKQGDKDDGKIFINKNWGLNLGKESYKAPTCVMTGPGDKFLYFGYEAEQEYGFLDETQRQTHHLFRHFKMSLHGKEITRSLNIAAIDGYEMKAIVIFQMALKYMKDHLIDRLDKQLLSRPDVNLIRWVITVPAIWSDAAKQFMREAAFEAGCISTKSSSNLLVAIEPEAASIHGRDLPVNTFAQHVTGGRQSFEDNTELLIVDAGGGTTDITVHRILNWQSMEEIFIPSGIACGSTKIDKEFESLMCELLGEDGASLRRKIPNEFLSLMLKFEVVKKYFPGQKNTKMRIELPSTIADRLKGIQSSKGVSFSNGILLISYERAMALFEPVVSEIASHVGQLLAKEELRRVSALLLVGGLGTSEILRQRLETTLTPGIRIITPEEAELAVVKGAVAFGMNHQAIRSRIIRHTYGVDMEPRFKPEHKLSKKIIKEGEAFCDDVFQPYVFKGDRVEVGHSIVKKFFPRFRSQPHMSFDFFYTDKMQAELAEVEYVDSPHFTRCGGLTVMMPNTSGGLQREVQVEFFFGGTEIKVKARVVSSGEETEATIDMLLD